MKSLWGQGSRYLRVRRTVDVSPRLAKALIIGLILLAAFIFVAGDVGLWRLWTAQRDIGHLRKRIVELEARNELLSAEIERLRENDPFAIEKIAREKYGYLRDGDRVYRIITPDTEVENASGRRSALDRGSANP